MKSLKERRLPIDMGNCQVKKMHYKVFLISVCVCLLCGGCSDSHVHSVGSQLSENVVIDHGDNYLFAQDRKSKETTYVANNKSEDLNEPKYAKQEVVNKQNVTHKESDETKRITPNNTKATNDGQDIKPNKNLANVLVYKGMYLNAGPYFGFLGDAGSQNGILAQNYVDSGGIAVEYSPNINNDGRSALFAAHNPGAFSIFARNLRNGDIVGVYDANGSYREYVMSFYCSVPYASADNPPIAPDALSAEREGIIIQFCILPNIMLWRGLPT